MTPQQLIRKIKALPERAPHTEGLEKLLLKRPHWYASQKEHWLGWLGGYEGPGYYGRKHFNRDAEFAYNHCGCPPMALWLGEAAGIHEELVRKVAKSATQANDTFSAKCAAIRRVITWSNIEHVLEGRRVAG
jgi:hypothetical protein